MKIKHSIVTTDEEAKKLFMIACQACLTTYPSVEEQNAAVAQALIPFKKCLDDYVCLAFKAGKKIKKSKADTKDTTMYTDGTTPVV